jgi:hypothetical protein
MLQPIPLALLIAFALGLGWRISGERRFLVLAALWSAYAAYEYLMYTRVLCSGECNIRVGLLLIYPALLISSIWVTVAAVFRRHLRKSKTGF